MIQPSADGMFAIRMHPEADSSSTKRQLLIRAHNEINGAMVVDAKSCPRHVAA
jgi:hypothetical protein